MPYLLNAAYLTLLLILSPWLVYKSIKTRKYRRGLFRKFTGRALLRDADAPCAWFHGVSVGEIHLLGQVVARFQQRHPDWDCVISTTTDTGFGEACKRFPHLAVFYWPLDFTWAVHRALRSVNPSMVVLAEGELWPNFLLAAKSRGITVALINGRMSPRSFAQYSFLAPVIRRLCLRVDLFAVQTEEYAQYFRRLGANPGCIQVTGSVKYDGVIADRRNTKTRDLATLFQVGTEDLIWIAGSTQSPEEQLALDVYRRVKPAYRSLRLFIVPRQKERFDEVARLLRHVGQPFVRRIELNRPLKDRSAIVLVDTIGELGALWGLADIAFVGGSLDGRRGGQNMIEPAAYGAAVIFGPHVWNFRDTARRLIDAGGAVQVADSVALSAIVERLLSDRAERRRLGDAAREFVRSQQGATERTVQCLDRLLMATAQRQDAA
jgi:3-deoxy-D-manno-octulosonic-acid transferase